jgi:hypothetical protein
MGDAYSTCGSHVAEDVCREFTEKDRKKYSTCDVQCNFVTKPFADNDIIENIQIGYFSLGKGKGIDSTGTGELTCKFTKCFTQFAHSIGQSKIMLHPNVPQFLSAYYESLSNSRSMSCQ